MGCSAINNGPGLRNWSRKKKPPLKPKNVGVTKKVEPAQIAKSGFQGLQSTYCLMIEAREYPNSLERGTYYSPNTIRDLLKEIYEINHRYCSDMYVSRETEITTDMGNGYTIRKYPRTKSFVVSGPNKGDNLEVSLNFSSNAISRIKRSDANGTFFVENPNGEGIEETNHVKFLSKCTTGRIPLVGI